jgi:hypothetical protein
MRRTFAAALCLALVALPAAAAFGQTDDPSAL